MSIQVRAELTGTRALMDSFDQMETRTAANSLKRVARRGGNVFKKEVQRLAPVETGQLKRSVQLTIKVLGRLGEVSAMTRVRSNKNAKTGRNPVHYNHLVVRGTRPHQIPGPLSFNNRTYAGPINHPGYRGNHFWDRAYNRKGNVILRGITSELQKELRRVSQVTMSRTAIRELLN